MTPRAILFKWHSADLVFARHPDEAVLVNRPVDGGAPFRWLRVCAHEARPGDLITVAACMEVARVGSLSGADATLVRAVVTEMEDL